MKTFGHAHFCRCLGENLTVFLSFLEYIVIVTDTKTEWFANLEAEERQGLFDRTIQIREQCVANLFGPQ